MECLIKSNKRNVWWRDFLLAEEVDHVSSLVFLPQVVLGIVIHWESVYCLNSAHELLLCHTQEYEVYVMSEECSYCQQVNNASQKHTGGDIVFLVHTVECREDAKEETSYHKEYSYFILEVPIRWVQRYCYGVIAMARESANQNKPEEVRSLFNKESVSAINSPV